GPSRRRLGSDLSQARRDGRSAVQSGSGTAPTRSRTLDGVVRPGVRGSPARSAPVRGGCRRDRRLPLPVQCFLLLLVGRQLLWSAVHDRCPALPLPGPGSCLGLPENGRANLPPVPFGGRSFLDAGRHLHPSDAVGLVRLPLRPAALALLRQGSPLAQSGYVLLGESDPGVQSRGVCGASRALEPGTPGRRLGGDDGSLGLVRTPGGG